MTELLLGMSLGLGAGISPGPLLGLVLATTLQRGIRAGVQVALSPLITDGPIITVVLLVLHELPARALGLLALVGAGYVIWLGAGTLIRVRRTGTPTSAAQPAIGRDLWRGSLVNLLSPHPWLFWIGIGGPILIHAWHRSPAHAVAFLVGMFGLLVGSKTILATVAATARGRLNPVAYRRVLGASALLMMGTAVVMIVQFRHAAFG